MVLEIAEFSVTPGEEADFIRGYRHAVELVTTSPGCLSVRMTRGIETPSRFILLVEWESVAAHDTGFRESERFPRWREAIGRYFAAPPQVEHVVDVPVSDE